MTDTVSWKFPVNSEVRVKDGYGTKRERKLTWRVTGHTTEIWADKPVPAYQLAAVGLDATYTVFTEDALKSTGYAINMDFRVDPKGPDWHTVIERTRATADTMQEEIVTDPETGGQKGKKPLQMGAIDPLARAELGKVAAFGGDKYDRGNYLKGYDWSLSVDALHRHMLAFESGEDYDAESGLLHVVHAAWHCLALASFKLRDLGTDDRFLYEDPEG